MPKGPRGERRPADVVGAAVMAAKIATGEITEAIQPKPESAAAELGRKALDTESKLIVSYLSGGRDSEYAMVLMDDLHSRLANRVQLTTDGHKAYLEAVEDAFGEDIDYAMLVKLYGEAP